MLATGTRLAQVRPTDTAVLEAFSTNSPTVEITAIYVANTTISAADFSLYHSIGTTDVANETTALFRNKEVAGNDTFVIRAAAVGGGIFVGNKLQDKIFVQSSAASAFTFTFYGVPARIADPQTSVMLETTGA